MIQGLTWYYFTLNIETCNEKSRIEGDPQCSSEAEIDKWMANKKIQFKMIDQKMDFTTDQDKSNVKKTMKSGKTIPLSRDTFTKAEIEYRRNIVESKKSPYKFWESKSSYFYDYVLVVFDSFTKDDSKPTDSFMLDVTENHMSVVWFSLSS